MSVLVPDLRVFNYIQAGIEKIAYNSLIDEFHSYSIQKYFKNCPDISKEAEKLILSWLNMNQMSYNKRYPNDKDDTNLCGMYYSTYTHKPLTAIQLLKYLECVLYNIEIEPEDIYFKTRLELLKNCTDELTRAIIAQTEEYKHATWSE